MLNVEPCHDPPSASHRKKRLLMTVNCYCCRMKSIRCLFFALALALSANAAQPINALFLTGGGYHDYKKLAPYLTNSFGERVNVHFDTIWDMNTLKDPNFATGYDVLVFDVCFDEVEPALIENALKAIHDGKPAVMIHCAVHAFRRDTNVLDMQIGSRPSTNSVIREWENGVGMRSKVHDKYGPFAVQKLDKHSPILAGFPNNWKTPGDELYQTIEFPKTSHPLLRARSPQDGREHIVCWTHTYGKGRVFATTLGHDMKTAQDNDYLGLISRGLLWACDKLDRHGDLKK
jgi:type 1 glutamine amidotransferase